MRRSHRSHQNNQDTDLFFCFFSNLIRTEEAAVIHGIIGLG